MSRTYKIQKGDWVVLRNSEGMSRQVLGKVLSADSSSVRAEFRFDGSPEVLSFEGDSIHSGIRRIKWIGRGRWQYA